MNKLKTFFYSFKKSISSTTYYRDIVKTKFQFSLKYFAFLIYVSLFVSTLIFALEAALMLPKLPQALDTIETRLENVYPQDLIITIQDNKLSTNKENPFYIDIPELQDTEEYEHLITFDTEGSVENYSEYETVFLVTDRSIVYPDSDRQAINGYRVSEINSEQDVTFTRGDYNNLLAGIAPVYDWIPRVAPWLLVIGVLLFPLLGTFFTALWNFAAVAFLSLITWAISGIFKNGLSYTKILQMGLHAVTIPILLVLLLNVMRVDLPLIFIASFLLWMVFILAKYKESTT